MADPKPQGPLPSPGRRQRAPTITIDTSAVSSSTSPPVEMGADALPLRTLNNPTQGDTSNPSARNELMPSSISVPPSGHGSQASHSSIPQLRETTSFESRDSRPTSPHNVSSPTARGDTGFLSVPVQRSRHNSVDSDDGYHSATSYGGETFLGTSAGGSAMGDRDHLVPNKSGNEEIMNDEQALVPDQDTVADFEVKDNRFAFSQGQLNKLIDPKSLPAFWALGGLAGLEKGLRTDRRAGLSSDEARLDGTVSFEEAASKGSKDATTSAEQPSLQKSDAIPSTEQPTLQKSDTSALRPVSEHETGFYDRKRIFKDNRLPEKKGKSLLQLMWITYNDKVLILLSVAAVVSLAVGLYQTLGIKHQPGEPSVEWVEGVAIMIAIAIVVIVGSLNDYQKERQFVKLNKKKTDRQVKVKRSGKVQEISVFDILVGDVVLLEAGDMIPVDGILIEGHNIKCDESQTTGESDLMRKKPADEVWHAIENHENVRKIDPFILSGAQVTEGIGSFLVTSTGVNSSYGKTLMGAMGDPDPTPLQTRLNNLAELIAKVGGAAGLLLFIVLFIKFLAQLPTNDGSATEKAQQFLNIFIVAVTVIVVAVPEGLPLAVTLALAFATTRMLKDNNLVRHLQACEVMGNATAICSDKTGTLTQNKMTVVAGTMGTSSRFGGTSRPATQNAESGPIENISSKEVVSSFGPEVSTLLKDSIALNSTAFEAEEDGVQTFVGSKTETALLEFARELLGMGPVSEERSNATVIQFIPFDSARKCMGIVVKLSNSRHRLYVKGASEILLAKCTSIIRDPTKEISSIQLTDDNRETLNKLINTYATRSLRTIALLYRDFDRWPPRGARFADGERTDVRFDDIFNNMTFLGVIGIQDPLREGVREAVETCQRAGAVVRMVTGDNMTTAKAIAEECGIFTAGGIVMEGPTFRNLSNAEKDQIIPRLQVLARSSPRDKEKLVERLKFLGEIVAVTGDGTNDAPALKKADVGFSMGIAGTEVAKEASAIILMDDNFASIVKAMMWGRAVNDSVKKFVQFQITVNITAVLLTFITAVANADESSVLTAVQLLWVNLIMDTMAALALATDPPTPSILNRKPDPRSAPLISITMWKMIIGQAIYQLVITLVLNFGAKMIFGYGTTEETEKIPTLVFNTFVWMQIFNQWNNRRLDNHFNIFEGVTRNWFFMGINVIMIGAQILIIFIGGASFSVKPLNGAQWGYSIILGFLSIPLAVAIRLVPDELLSKLVPDILKSRSQGPPEVTVSDEERQFRFPQPLVRVREELSWLKRVKGGRLNNLKFAIQHPKETFISRSRSGSRSRSNSFPVTPISEFDREDSFGSPARTPESRKRGRSNRSRSNSALGATAVMAGIIAGSVAGWSPIDRTSHDNESMRFSRSQGRTDLESREGVEVHPATKPDDPVIVEAPAGRDLPPSQIPEINPAPAFGSSLAPPSTTRRSSNDSRS